MMPSAESDDGKQMRKAWMDEINKVGASLSMFC
jgi:hypothetical protein